MSIYSKVDEKMACSNCRHSQIMEGESGQTRVDCMQMGMPVTLDFVVSKCNRHAKEETHKLYDHAKNVRIEEGHCWINTGITRDWDNDGGPGVVRKYARYGWFRVDTLEDDKPVLGEFY